MLKTSGRGSGRERNDRKEKVEQLRAILPGITTAAKAELLLARAGGDVAGAVTWFYDGGGARGGGGQRNAKEGASAKDSVEGKTDLEQPPVGKRGP